MHNSVGRKMSSRAHYALKLRLRWVEVALANVMGASLINDIAEQNAIERFDVRALKINSDVDEVRRELFKVSCVKSMLEVVEGSYRNELEVAHRERLLYQSEEDFFEMIHVDDYPPLISHVGY